MKEKVKRDSQAETKKRIQIVLKIHAGKLLSD